jgi:hypothetical protein
LIKTILDPDISDILICSLIIATFQVFTMLTVGDILIFPRASWASLMRQKRAPSLPLQMQKELNWLHCFRFRGIVLVTPLPFLRHKKLYWLLSYCY